MSRSCSEAIDQVIAQHQVNFEMMWYYLSRILVMVILSSAATWLMNVINNRMTYQTVKDIRAKAIRHIQVLPLSYLDGHSTGDIISRIIADTRYSTMVCCLDLPCFFPES